MSKRTARRWVWALGIAACALFIGAFPVYYAFVRNFMSRRRDTSMTATTGLSRMDRVDLALEHELNKRLRSLGLGLYRLTSGRIARLAGAPAEVLILTVRGRRSGRERSVMLQGFWDGADLIVVAANSGQPAHPDWFYNLKAAPTARIRIMDRSLRVRAEELPANETAAFWPRILRIAPSYARFRQATSRPIPLVRLIPLGQTRESAMSSGIAHGAQRSASDRTKPQ